MRQTPSHEASNVRQPYDVPKGAPCALHGGRLAGTRLRGTRPNVGPRAAAAQCGIKPEEHPGIKLHPPRNVAAGCARQQRSHGWPSPGSHSCALSTLEGGSNLMPLLWASLWADMLASSTYRCCDNFCRGSAAVGPVSARAKRRARSLLSAVIRTCCRGIRW